MIIKRDGLIGRLYFWTKTSRWCNWDGPCWYESYSTDLCEVMRTLMFGLVFFSILKLALITLLLCIVGAIIWLMWANLHNTLIVFGFLCAVSLFMATVYFIAKHFSMSETSRIIEEYIKAKKEKYCPYVEFK